MDRSARKSQEIVGEFSNFGSVVTLCAKRFAVRNVLKISYFCVEWDKALFQSVTIKYTLMLALCFRLRLTMVVEYHVANGMPFPCQYRLCPMLFHLRWCTPTFRRWICRWVLPTCRYGTIRSCVNKPNQHCRVHVWASVSIKNSCQRLRYPRDVNKTVLLCC